MSKSGKYSCSNNTSSHKSNNRNHSRTNTNRNRSRTSSYSKNDFVNKAPTANQTIYDKSRIRREERVAESQRYDWREEMMLYWYVFGQSLLFFTVLAIAWWFIANENSVYNFITYGTYYSWVFMEKFFGWCANVMDAIYPIWVSFWNN